MNVILINLSCLDIGELHSLHTLHAAPCFLQEECTQGAVP